MTLDRKTIRKAALFMGLALLAAGLAAPFLNADRFGERIRAALEGALGRKVEIGEAHFNLFRGPGFSLRNVVIHEDPAAGIEPFAYVDSLEARVSLRSLWTGRLEFSSLRLVEPSVNLVKTAAGPWNFQALLNRPAGSALPAGSRPPEILVRSGRLNFKFGDVKSAFYLAGADLDVLPLPGPQGALQFRLTGEPSRTDRAAQGFGRLTGRGRWRFYPDREGRLELELELERSALVEFVTLFHGHDVGVHGLIASRARLVGPLSGLDITGQLQVSDLHRWDVMPPYAPGWPLTYHGRLDLLSQDLELETREAENPALPVSVSLRAHGYLSTPRWSVLVSAGRLPLEPLRVLAAKMGIRALEPLALSGTVAGAVGYSAGTGLQGAVLAEGAVANAGEPATLRFEDARLLLDAGRAQLLPSRVRTGDEEAAQLEAEYQWDEARLDVRVSTARMNIARLFRDPALLHGMVQVPVLGHCRGGWWDGRLRYRTQPGQPGGWAGSFGVHEAEIELPGVADPLLLERARVSLDKGRVEVSGMQGRVGLVELRGDYRWEPERRRPHWFHVALAETEAPELERLLLPSLRRPQGFLARTLRVGRGRLPDWLAYRHVEGTLDVAALGFGDVRVEKLRARIFWDAGQVEITGLSGTLAGGELSGYLSADLRGAAPLYHAGVRVESASLKEGRFSADTVLEGSGAGAELIASLTANGSLSGRSLPVGPDAQLSSVTGSFELTSARSTPRLRFRDLRVEMAGDVLIGQGGTIGDGRVQFELTGGNKTVRIDGTLTPLQLELAGR